MSKRPFSCTPSSSMNSTSENVPEHEPVSASRPLAIADLTAQLNGEFSRTSRADVQPGSNIQSTIPSRSLSLPSEHWATAGGGCASSTKGRPARFRSSARSRNSIARGSPAGRGP